VRCFIFRVYFRKKKIALIRTLFSRSLWTGVLFGRRVVSQFDRHEDRRDGHGRIDVKTEKRLRRSHRGHGRHRHKSVLYPSIHSPADPITVSGNNCRPGFRGARRTGSTGYYRGHGHFRHAPLETAGVRRRFAGRGLRGRISRQRRIHGVSIL